MGAGAVDADMGARPRCARPGPRVGKTGWMGAIGRPARPYNAEEAGDGRRGQPPAAM